MNYYKRHLGDYAKDTRHLSMAEHGAFTLLLDYYYATEKPIPNDRCERIANAFLPDEQKVVRSVLKEFFFLTPEGWRNGKADEVIAESQAKSLKAKESAENRWMRTQCDGNANASETHPVLDASHKPLAISQIKLSQPDACPHADIVALYHEILPSLIAVKDWTDDRQKLLRTRWREKPERQSLEWWRTFFEYVAASDFLMGRKEGRDGPFDCSLEWLIRPKNFLKVIEGNYENKARP